MRRCPCALAYSISPSKNPSYEGRSGSGQKGNSSPRSGWKGKWKIATVLQQSQGKSCSRRKLPSCSAEVQQVAQLSLLLSTLQTVLHAFLEGFGAYLNQAQIGKRNLPFHYPKSPAALQKSPFWALVTLMLLLHELGKLLLEQQCLPVLEITSLAATQTSLQTATIRSRFHIYLKNYQPQRNKAASVEWTRQYEASP